MKFPKLVLHGLFAIIAAAMFYSTLYMQRQNFRDDGPSRGDGSYLFYRYFKYDWEARIFAPAAWAEAILIRLFPTTFYTYPNWIEVDQPSSLLLKGEQAMTTMKIN